MLDRLLQFVTGSPAFQFLRGVTPFEFLPDGELGRIGDVLGIDYHPKGSTLYVHGQSAVKDVHVVMTGSLELVDDGAGPPKGEAKVGSVGAGGLPADNLVSTGEISALEQRFLEDSFRLIGRVQASSSRKFLRTM